MIPTIDRPTPQDRRRVILWVILRAIGSVTVLLVAYYLLPMDRPIGSMSLFLLTVGLLVLVVVVAWRVRGIIRSDRPGLRAIESLAAAVPLYILLFATAYFLAERAYPGSFSQPMDRTGALYFSATVFSTVGFGDITAKTDAARLVVTTQMFLDLLVLGLGVRIVLGAVQTARQRQGQQLPGDGTTAQAPSSPGLGG